MIGKPRRMLFAMPSQRPDSDWTATVAPTATGTRTATPSQIFRTRSGGTEPESGTKAKTKSAAFGATTPRSRIGHAAAAATMPHRKSCRWPVTRPKRLTTAQSSSAERIRPTVRVMKLTIAWISAIGIGQRALRRREPPAARRLGSSVFSCGRISCS